jgi:hypothetical protein
LVEASTYLLAGGMTSISAWPACGQTRPTRRGVGAATVRIVSKKSD